MSKNSSSKIPKLLVSDVMIRVRTPIISLYVCEFSMVCYFVNLRKSQLINEIILSKYIIFLLTLLNTLLNPYYKKKN
jgi:hypothetical protein